MIDQIGPAGEHPGNNYSNTGKDNKRRRCVCLQAPWHPSTRLPWALLCWTARVPAMIQGIKRESAIIRYVAYSASNFGDLDKALVD